MPGWMFVILLCLPGEPLERTPTATLKGDISRNIWTMFDIGQQHSSFSAECWHPIVEINYVYWQTTAVILHFSLLATAVRPRLNCVLEQSRHVCQTDLCCNKWELWNPGWAADSLSEPGESQSWGSIMSDHFCVTWPLKLVCRSSKLGFFFLQAGCQTQLLESDSSNVAAITCEARSSSSPLKHHPAAGCLSQHTSSPWMIWLLSR